jgi:Domain of unknown function (DUF4261)
MPRKGFFTQGMAILLHNALPLQAIEERLGDFEIVKRMEASGPWVFGGGPTVLVAYRPEVNGYVSVEVVDRCWPDQMGDTKAEPDVFAAWGMGHFGPGAWPGGLERACRDSYGWPEDRLVPQHQAFVRILCSYVLGAGGDAPIKPSSYDPLPELEFMTRIAGAIVHLPEAVCYFNPNGECVRDARGFQKALDYHASAELMPLELWVNVRLFNFSDAEPAWSLMDTVGMSQLDTPDHEACYQSDVYATAEVENFLRNASAYLVQRGPIIGDGHTMDGPAGIRWQAFIVDEGLLVPPREVLRWFPQDQGKVPAKLRRGIQS